MAAGLTPWRDYLSQWRELAHSSTLNFSNTWLKKNYTNMNNIFSNTISMHYWTGSAWSQVVACPICSTKPLSEPMLTCWALGPKKQKTTISIQENWFEQFSYENWQPIWFWQCIHLCNTPFIAQNHTQICVGNIKLCKVMDGWRDGWGMDGWMNRCSKCSHSK